MIIIIKDEYLPGQFLCGDQWTTRYYLLLKLSSNIFVKFSMSFSLSLSLSTLSLSWFVTRESWPRAGRYSASRHNKSSSQCRRRWSSWRGCLACSAWTRTSCGGWHSWLIGVPACTDVHCTPFINFNFDFDILRPILKYSHSHLICNLHPVNMIF